MNVKTRTSRRDPYGPLVGLLLPSSIAAIRFTRSALCLAIPIVLLGLGPQRQARASDARTEVLPPNYIYTFDRAVWDCRPTGPWGEEYCTFLRSSVLSIFDISEPDDPRRVGITVTGGDAHSITNLGFEATDLAVSGNYLYLAGAIVGCLPACNHISMGLQVIDVSDPSQPRIISNWPTLSGPLYAEFPSYTWADTAVSLVGDFGFLRGSEFLRGADGRYRFNEAFHVIDLTDPANPRTLSSRFHPSIKARPLSNAMLLTVAGPPRLTARVQRSTDLRTWTDWLPLTFSQMPLEIADIGYPQTGSCFYRLAMP